MDAMFIPAALLTVMALSFGVIVVLVAREVHKRWRPSQALRDIRYRKQFQLRRWSFQQPGLRHAPGIIPIILKVRIGCEADDMYLYGSIRIPKATFQTPVEFGQ
jgi:hypothetical protein